MRKTRLLGMQVRVMPYAHRNARLTTVRVLISAMLTELMIEPTSAGVCT